MAKFLRIETNVALVLFVSTLQCIPYRYQYACQCWAPARALMVVAEEETEDCLDIALADKSEVGVN